jgi:soluble lytic murein transglycosylase-like protein
MRRKHISAGAVAAAVALLAPPSSEAHVRYRVRIGDTLTSVAAAHGTTVSALARANRLNPAGTLYAGMILEIPARRSMTATAAVSQPWLVRVSIDRWARRYGVDARLVRAVAWIESGFQPSIFSHAGAWGVMQVTPATWDFVETVLVGHRVRRNTDGNVRVGTAFLHHLLHSFGGSERLALAAYYQGARSVRAHGLFRETRLYVRNVLAVRARL